MIRGAVNRGEGGVAGHTSPEQGNSKDSLTEDAKLREGHLGYPVQERVTATGFTPVLWPLTTVSSTLMEPVSLVSHRGIPCGS